MSGDESVTFSLRELEELERDRIAREERERAAREAEREESAARALADERRREEEEREAEKRRELEEIARREAMQKALVEQTRIEVEARARASEAERERQHEIELARLRSAAARERRPVGLALTSGLASAAVVLAGAFAVHLGVLRPSSEARLAEITLEAKELNLRANDLERRTEEQQATIDALRAALERERERAQAAKLEPPVADAPTTHRRKRGGPQPPSVGTTPKRAPARGPECLKGDPLCPTIQ